MTKQEKIDREIEKMSREQDWSGPGAAVIEEKMRSILSEIFFDDLPPLSNNDTYKAAIEVTGLGKRVLTAPENTTLPTIVPINYELRNFKVDLIETGRIASPARFYITSQSGKLTSVVSKNSDDNMSDNVTWKDYYWTNPSSQQEGSFRKEYLNSDAMSTIVEQIQSLTLAQAAALVTELENTFGVSRYKAASAKEDRVVSDAPTGTVRRHISFDDE